MRPKILGAWNLHFLSKEHPLDFFVLFSSLNAPLGGIGETAYCAANLFLDAFAHYRIFARGSFTLSINWDANQRIAICQTTPKCSFIMDHMSLVGL